MGSERGVRRRRGPCGPLLEQTGVRRGRVLQPLQVVWWGFAVVVKVALLDGTARAYERRSDLMTGARAWIVLAEAAEVEVDALLARARARDPDLWVIELEDRQGRTLLDQDGLSD